MPTFYTNDEDESQDVVKVKNKPNGNKDNSYEKKSQNSTFFVGLENDITDNPNIQCGNKFVGASSLFTNLNNMTLNDDNANRQVNIESSQSITKVGNNIQSSIFFVGLENNNADTSNADTSNMTPNDNVSNEQQSTEENQNITDEGTETPIPPKRKKYIKNMTRNDNVSNEQSAPPQKNEGEEIPARPQRKNSSCPCPPNEGEEIPATPKRKKSSCPCPPNELHHPQQTMWHIAGTKVNSINRFKRSKSKNWDENGIFDPYRTFEVKQEKCFELSVTVHQGENISKGSKLKDVLDTPDPYIVLRIPKTKINTPHRTTTVNNSTNPTWNQTFGFFLYESPIKPYLLEISLMDANYLKDEVIDTQSLNLDCLEEGKSMDHTVTFKGNSKVFITLLKLNNKETDLRFSMSLCDEEKAFLHKRIEKVYESMKAILGEDGPNDVSEVPTIGILGSGGGFRAMIGLSGALRALQDSGLLDCVTYLAGLSGSTWCISTLYCQNLMYDIMNCKENMNENNKENIELTAYKKCDENDNGDFSPFSESKEELIFNRKNNFHGPLNVKEFQEKICESVGKKWEWNIPKLPQYLVDMLSKYWKGQSMTPPTLVEIFGHLIGDVLLGKEDKKLLRLSDLQSRISTGEVPFPLFAGLHATERASDEFSEWIEFSPYEIGMGKYGTFMKTEHFGSKFFAGKLLKEYDEMFLHSLQGIWGSAFTVNLKKHLIGATMNVTEDNDEYADEKLCLNDSDSDSIDSEEEVENSPGRFADSKRRKSSVDNDKRPGAGGTFEDEQEEYFELKVTVHRGEKITKGSRLKDALDTPDPYIVLRIPQLKLNTPNRTETKDNTTNPRWDQTLQFSLNKSSSEPYVMEIVLMDENDVRKDEEIDSQSFQLDSLEIGKSKECTFTFKGDSKVFVTFVKQKKYRNICLDDFKKKNWLVSAVEKIDCSFLLNNRPVKPGRIYNPFRGLSLKYSFVKDPNTQERNYEEEENLKYANGCKFQPLSEDSKKISVMDSGFSCNSPYPLLLRPQRAVDIFLSFDFSKRNDDKLCDLSTFKQLVKSEEWAKERHIPFPPVKEKIAELQGSELEECYVFESSDDAFVPVILHFPLVNNKFRKYESPGVPRSSEEDFDFPCFGKNSEFGTFKFNYDSTEFDRLAKLMEFNTLLHKNTIIEEIKKSIIKKREGKKIDFYEIVKILMWRSRNAKNNDI